MTNCHQLKMIAQDRARKNGGSVGGEARVAIEKRTGKPVITSKNAAQLQGLVTDLLETEIKSNMDN